MRIRTRRGQFQVLAALVLAALMITARTLVVSDYSTNLRDVNSEMIGIRAQVVRATIVAAAYASNAPGGNMTALFREAMLWALANITAANYGLSLDLLDAAIFADWSGASSTTAAGASVNATSATLKSNWMIRPQIALAQSVQTGSIVVTHPLPSLISLQIPVNFTLTVTSAASVQTVNWSNGTLTYNGGTYPVTLSKNYGNGQILLAATLPYAGPGTYSITLNSWEASLMTVSSVFVVSV